MLQYRRVLLLVQQSQKVRTKSNYIFNSLVVPTSTPLSLQLTHRSRP